MQSNWKKLQDYVFVQREYQNTLYKNNYLRRENNSFESMWPREALGQILLDLLDDLGNDDVLVPKTAIVIFINTTLLTLRALALQKIDAKLHVI